MNLLERDDFETFLTGCIRTETTDRGMLLHRHTEKQVDYYEKANESWWIRSLCPAGIKLSIQTNSRTLDLTGRIRAGARQYAGFDVEVDNRHIGAHRIDTSDETQTLRLAEFARNHLRRIVLTFPQSAIPEIDSITLEDGADISPIDRPNFKYLAIGDSITQGMDARGPASAYTLQISRMLNAELLNIGVGGHIYDLNALDDALPYAPEIVTVAYGTNDWRRGTTREQIAETVEQYLDRLVNTVALTAQIFLLTPIWREIGNESKAGGTLLQFSSSIADAASVFTGVTVVDGTTLVPNRSDLFVDGTHPNDEGFLHYAINLSRIIR